MTARYPVEGFTVERIRDDWFRLYYPSGDDLLGEYNANQLAARGIPLPPEPRTGRLGLNEADTREMAKRLESVSDDTWSRCYNASILMCREDVAEWDARPEPDTLTVTLPPLPVADVQYLAHWRWGSEAMEAVSAACRAALDAAGLR